MDITFLMLTYFQKIAQTQHLTRAAEQLHVSQPALSKTLSSLEEILQTPLFDRTGRGITLNRNGEIFLQYTNRILAELADAKRALDAAGQEKRRRVTLALRVASSVVPDMLTEFKLLHPQIMLQILQQDNAEDGENSAKQADLTLFSSLYPVENEHTRTILREELMIAMPERLGGRDPSPVNLSDFSNAEFICLQKGKSLRSITDVYFQMAGFSPNISLESDSPQTVREFVRAGVGLSLIPGITWSSVRGDRITLRPVASPRCQRYIGISWRENQSDPEATELLRDFLTDRFQACAEAAEKKEKA